MAIAFLEFGRLLATALIMFFAVYVFFLLFMLRLFWSAPKALASYSIFILMTPLLFGLSFFVFGPVQSEQVPVIAGYGVFRFFGMSEAWPSVFFHYGGLAFSASLILALPLEIGYELARPYLPRTLQRGLRTVDDKIDGASDDFAVDNFNMHESRGMAMIIGMSLVIVAVFTTLFALLS
jgi:hypothetical protein